MTHRLRTYKSYCQQKFGHLTSRSKETKFRAVMTAWRSRRQYTYSDSFKFIECRVPKSGTTKRAEWLWPIFHSTPYSRYAPHPTADRLVPKLDNLGFSQIKEKLRNYTSFMFVRDPIVRFISGYLSKIQSQKFENRPILKEARKFLNDTDLSRPLSLGEFARYIAGLYDLGKEIPNKHFAGYFNFCGKCAINYTFIG